MVFMAFSETEPKIFAEMHGTCLAALSFAKIDVEEDGGCVVGGCLGERCDGVTFWHENGDVS